MTGLPFLRLPHQRFVLFVLLAAAAIPLSAAFTGILGLSGSNGNAAFGAGLAVLLATAAVVVARLSGERLADLGFTMSRHQTGVAVGAFVVGASASVGVVGLLGAASGASWLLNRSVSGLAAVAGLLPVLCFFLAEELLFRGYAFQQLRRMCGAPSAIALSAAAFGAYHLVGSGDWAMGAAFRFLMPALAGVVFAWALVRTGSIVVPIALHWGVNWAQSCVLGLGQAPGAHSARWVMPLAPEQAQTLAAPDLLPHLPYLAALALTLVLVLKYRRRHGLTTV